MSTESENFEIKYVIFQHSSKPDLKITFDELYDIIERLLKEPRKHE